MAQNNEKEIEELKKANKELGEAKISLEAELRQKIGDLEKFRRLTIGRELVMIHLKNEIAGLQAELGRVRTKAVA